MIGIVVTVAAAAIDIELIVIAVDLVTIAKAAVKIDVNIVVVRVCIKSYAILARALKGLLFGD